MAALDTIASELLKSANEADLNFKKTRDQAQRDKAVRLRKIVENLKAISAGGLTPTLDQVLTQGNTSTNTLNVGGITTDYVQLDTAATPILAPGMFGWNDAYGTADLRLKGNNVTLQLGQETLARVVNKTGSDLLESEYKVVRVRIASEGGAQGQRLAVVLAQGLNDPDSATTLGIVTETIPNNQEGFITVFGNVNNINTTGSLQGETWADGDVLYLSPTIAGGLTKVKPIAPQHMVVMGYVVYAHAINGKIFVKVDNGYELDELHNVLITSPANNDLLQYNSAQQVWKNVAASVAVPTPTLAQVTTAGNTTTNAITVGGLNVNGIQVITSADVANRDVGPAAFNITNGTFSRFNVVYDASIARINILGTSTEGLRIEGGSGSSITKIGSGGITISAPSNNLYLNGASLLFATGNVERARVNSNGNFLIGTTTDAGYKFDVNGTARIVGTDIPGVFTVGWGKSNSITLGSNTANSPQIYLGSISLTAHPGGSSLAIDPGLLTTTNAGANTNRPITLAPVVTGTSTGNIVLLSSGARISANRHVPTSGVLNMVMVGGAAANQYMDFAPSSGNAEFNSISIVQQINTSGTYAGIVRGIYYNPILTSITGVTHRAIETVSGDVIFGSTSGSVGIGTTSIYSTTKLKVKGADSGLILLVSGDTKGVRIGADTNGGFISGVDQTGFGSDQPLAFRATKYQFDLGNVLINTSTDAGYKLDVNGTGRVNNTFTVTKSGSNNYFNFEPSATGAMPYVQAFYQGAVDSRLYFDSSFLKLRYAGSTLLYGLDCGNINASGTVLLSGTGDQKVHLFGSTNNFVQFSDAGATNIGVIGTADATTYIQVRTGNATNMSTGTLSAVFFNSGNVGINTTTDTGEKLQVNGSIKSSALTLNGPVLATGGVLSSIAGYTGLFTVPTNPPGMQTLDIQNGIIVNIL